MAETAAVENAPDWGQTTEPPVDVGYMHDLFCASQGGIRRWGETQERAIREVRRANGWLFEGEDPEPGPEPEVNLRDEHAVLLDRMLRLEDVVYGEPHVALADDVLGVASGITSRQRGKHVTPMRLTVQDMLRERANLLRGQASDLDRLAARIPALDPEDDETLRFVMTFGLGGREGY